MALQEKNALKIGNHSDPRFDSLFILYLSDNKVDVFVHFDCPYERLTAPGLAFGQSALQRNSRVFYCLHNCLFAGLGCTLLPSPHLYDSLNEMLLLIIGHNHLVLFSKNCFGT